MTSAPKTARRARAKSPAEIDRLVRGALALVIKTARSYSIAGVQQDDLVAAGNLGLFHAAQRFDKQRGWKFTTYAIYWIRAFIFLEIEKATGKRLSQDERRIFYRGPKAREALRRLGVVEPSDAQIAEYLGVRARAFDSLRARSMISADQERGLALVSYKELLVTEDGASPEAMVARAEAEVVTSRRLETAISALGQRERYVVQQRFFSKKPQTLAAIGRKLGVSREYVRQVVEKATKKLRGHLERDADDLAFGE